jgi:5-methylcytosine-specific restriction endonuclease McrA
MASRNPTEVKGEDRDPRFPPDHGRGRDQGSRRRRRERYEKFLAQEGLCWWCREKMSMEALRITEAGNWKDNKRYASFEHLIPRSHGGKNATGNRVLAHAGCNNKRHRRKWPHDPIYGEQSVQGRHDYQVQGSGTESASP